MNRILFVAIFGAVAGGLLLAALSEQASSSEQKATESDRKFHFTQTVLSSPSPGIGHEGHQLAMILPPSNGTIYDGSMTYTASEPVQIVVLHEIDKADARGQPTWNIDGDTIYGWTLVKPDVSAGSFEYTGAALALHTGGDKFAATVTVDGWIRDAPMELTPSGPEIASQP